MHVQKALDFTLKRIVFGDMLLNWFLGAVMTFLPAGFDGVLGQGSLLPVPVYRVIGIIFLLFAAWQTWVIRKGAMSPADLVFGGLMAIGPVILLTAALLSDLPLKPVWRIVLWVGNVYMLFLGAWYFYLAKASRAGAEPTSA